MKKIYSFSFLCVALFSQCNPTKCEFPYMVKVYFCENKGRVNGDFVNCAGPGSMQEITDDTKPDNLKGKCQYGLTHDMYFNKEIEKCY